MVDRKSSSTGLKPAGLPLDIVRARTCDCHERLEGGMNWQAAFSSLVNYQRLLLAFAGLVMPIEMRIGEILDPAPPNYSPRRRGEWLQRDLDYLQSIMDQSGMVKTHGMMPELTDLAFVDVGFIFDQAGAIGALYVLEGSALGGQLLSRQLQAALPLSVTRGGSYFAGLGSQTVANWRLFSQWANDRLTQLAGAEAAAQAARETFHCFEKNVTGLSYE